MKKIVFGIAVFVLGAIVIPMAMIIGTVLNQPAAKQFKVPGTAQVSIEEPGRYYLWNDFQTVYEGKSYELSERLPGGVEITIRDVDTGEEFDFVSSLTTSSSAPSSSKNSIGYIEVHNDTEISIEVAGLDDERVLSFSKSFVSKLVVMVIAGGLLSTVSALSGIVFTICGIVSLISKKAEAK